MVAMKKNRLGVELAVGTGRNRAGVGGLSWREPAPGRKFPEHWHRAGFGDVSRGLPPGSGGSCLERPAECFVAPGATSSRLIGVTDQEATSLGAAIKRIEINGQPAIESVEAFGSRAGSTFRGRPPLPGSDLDIYVTVKSGVANTPEAFQEVVSQVNEVSELFGQVKRFPVNPVVEIDALAPAHKTMFKQTPFIRLDK